MSPLLNISSIDGRYHGKTKELATYFSEYALIYYRYFIEIEWFIALSDEKNIPEVPTLSDQQKKFLKNLQDQFNLQTAESIKEIEKTTNHDVKAVEYQLKKDFDQHPDLKKHKEFLHFACTSEDINNTSYAMMLSAAKKDNLIPTLNTINQQLTEMAHQFADVSMLSRTHGQTASPTTLGKEIANTCARLTRQLNQLQQIEVLGKLNGAVGNYNAHIVAYPEVDWQNLSKKVIETQLGLTQNNYTTQIEPHDYIAEYCHQFSRINTILIDLCRDIWGYISLGYFKQKVIAGEVGSSTMPHKVNPIDFENAEGNFGISNALLEHLANKLPISRWQRDLTDSTTLRALGTAFGHAVIAYQSLIKGLNKLEINHDQISNDLNQRYEVLAEPIQTVMRRYEIEGAYEMLKALTRGKDMNAKTIQSFIEQLDIPNDAKASLLALKPENYTGLATKLAKDF